MPRLCWRLLLGELRTSGHRSRTITDELRHNLIRKLESGEPKFEGIVGFGETVVPHGGNAVLSGQDVIFLGERGQAKTPCAHPADDRVPHRRRIRDQR